MRRVTLFLVLAVLVVSGCATSMINKEALSNVKSAGIISLTIKNPGPDYPENRAVMQQAADYALQAVESRFKSVSTFRLLPASHLSKAKEFSESGSLSKSPAVRAYIKNLADTDPNFVMAASAAGAEDAMTALKAYLSRTGSEEESKQKAIANVYGAGQKKIDAFKASHFNAKPLGFIPYALLNENPSGAVEVKFVNGMRQEERRDYVKTLLIESAKAACVKAGLDAVIVVYCDVIADNPKGVYVISTGNRVLGTLRLNMTMMMIDKNGEIIADLDWPSMDDLAPNRLAKPTHLVTSWKGKDNKFPDKMVINLKDPHGTVFKEMKSLIAESSLNMVKTLRKELGEIQ